MHKYLLTATLLCLGFLLFPSVYGSVLQDTLELKRVDNSENKVLFYRVYAAKTTMELSKQDISKLSMSTGAGRVIVKGTDSDVIQVEAEIVLSAKNIDRAANIIQKFMVLSLEKEGGRASLKSHFDFHQRSDFAEAFNPNGFFSAPVRKIDLVVKVPKEMALSISDRSGDLSIEDMESNLAVTDRSGNIKIKNVQGDLKLDDSSGDIKLQDLNKNGNTNAVISINDRSGVIHLDHVNGNIKLSDRSGDVAIKNTKGNIQLGDASGNLDIQKIDGDLKLVDASGDIKARDITGNITLDDNSGGIYVSNVAKDIHVYSAGTGDLKIRNYDGKLSGDLKRLYK
ncbi:DUF4097 domain-containing protein [Fulvivirga sp. M361]|uniref:DUF4097 family beta strand repeat-containing protein n=1 Tax=Fulvivirga sp. M361 TaxID=2594266 RepID=UPI001179C221|nr:DUF4097 family beta strand repeat-containing protein [Fulvivirga sp. M361]TRX56171.1 DUF4097 domain-containing protein [Fulvivirga sp. M361]